MGVVTIHDVIVSSMILCVGASLVAGVYGYYITLIWTAVAIAYFEVSDTIIFYSKCGCFMMRPCQPF